MDLSLWLRPGLVAAAFALLLGLETLRPARAPQRGGRWLVNLGLGGCNFLLALALAPLASLTASIWAEGHGWGLLRQVSLPEVLELAIALVLLDCALYWQHRLMHRVPLLWAVHRLHHLDQAIDVTSGVRFNPLEIVISLAYQSVLVILLGASPFAVLVFGVTLTIASLFEHSALALPRWLDRWVRLLLVTPAMHLVHHGAAGRDMQHNFGFCLSLWDRLLGSYRPALSRPVLGVPEQATAIGAAR